MTAVEQNQPEARSTPARPSAPDGTKVLSAVLHGIEHHLYLRATYNRVMVIFGPHIVYEQGGETYVDATVLEQDGERFAQDMLSTFKLGGLRDARATTEGITILAGFSPDDTRYAQRVIAHISA